MNNRTYFFYSSKRLSKIYFSRNKRKRQLDKERMAARHKQINEHAKAWKNSSETETYPDVLSFRVKYFHETFSEFLRVRHKFPVSCLTYSTPFKVNGRHIWKQILI